MLRVNNKTAKIALEYCMRIDRCLDDFYLLMIELEAKPAPACRAVTSRNAELAAASSHLQA